ncbi:MAG: SH3 domain-containing protein [Lentisphaeria bacterium]|nr:SH3 domain-containing protein [Lentisphaeria bacterium]
MKIFLVTNLLLAMSAVFAAGTVQGTVKKFPLNVRAGAGVKYTAVAKLAKDNPVEITRVSNQWLAIKPPENSRVWIMNEFVKNGKLLRGVNLRSGPSTGYETVGFARRGTAVKIHGKPTSSGWVQISAPAGVEFYVGRPAIEADKTALSKLPKFKVPTGKVLPNEELINLEGNFLTTGKDITVTGYVYEEKQSHLKSVSHVLYEPSGAEDLIPRYMVMPNRCDFGKYQDKKVRVYGEFYKVKGWKLPLLVAKIVRSAE